MVLFKLPAQYGSEIILNTVYKKSGKKWKIHIEETKYKEYCCTSDLSDSVDHEFDNAKWIHACSWKDSEISNQITKGGIVFAPSYN